jgi:hypothetical protein
MSCEKGMVATRKQLTFFILEVVDGKPCKPCAAKNALGEEVFASSTHRDIEGVMIASNVLKELHKPRCPNPLSVTSCPSDVIDLTATVAAWHPR